MGILPKARPIEVALLLVLTALASTPAFAATVTVIDPYGADFTPLGSTVWSGYFGDVTDHVPGLDGSEYFLEVGSPVAGDPNLVTFRVWNLGSADANTGFINTVYWDITDPEILDFSSFASQNWLLTNATLPGGALLDPDFTAQAASNPRRPDPGHRNSIWAGDYQDFTIGLLWDPSVAALYPDGAAAIGALLASEDLRVGIHVQGLDGAGSDTFVTTVVPTPAAAGLGLLSMALVGTLRFLKGR